MVIDGDIWAIGILRYLFNTANVTNATISAEFQFVPENDTWQMKFEPKVTFEGFQLTMKNTVVNWIVAMFRPTIEKEIRTELGKVIQMIQPEVAAMNKAILAKDTSFFMVNAFNDTNHEMDLWVTSPPNVAGDQIITIGFDGLFPDMTKGGNTHAKVSG